ncbi:LysR family transcriptional regulator [Microcella daejeonensis]|uniref:LysR family transcriptional regulator n=1 Tax=Microcella daejeonensis TaxID=2994971 RepID=A0A9E8MM89_9MICO|nr:LysR family transcriptional regulator [Microcella daejeonensis]WAB82106.1 LysR family transcriptional regulator [Microcella daejeonensis]
MDVLAAARAFVSVSARGGFTDGAAALRIPQSVASRRIAALERQVGSPLFDRSRRGAALTPAGEGLLPVARRLVELGDEFLLVAEQGRRRTVRIAVPRTSIPALARIAAAGLQHDLTLECVEGDVPQRGRMLGDRVVAVAVLPARGG